MAATAKQMRTIRARAYDDTARAMGRDGVTLSHAQAEELGEEACRWLAQRLDLRMSQDADGVTFARGAGRPREYSARVPVALTAEQLERIDSAADAAGLTRSAWIRMTLLAACE